MLALGFVGFFVLFAAWAIATPPFAAPDEQYHVSRASGVARGQIVPPGNDRYGGGAGAVVEARGLAAAAAQWRCLQFHLGQNASCAGPISSDPGEIWVFSGAAKYAPVYYAVVGWPTLLAFDDAAVYLMRLVSAAWCAAMLAGALAIALRFDRHRWLGVGVVVAVTPQIAFLSGTINPNSVEIAAAVLTWTAGLAIAASPTPAPTSWFRWFAVGATSMVLMRQLSPFWLVGILAACAILAGRPRLRELRRSRRMYRWMLPPLVGTFLQLIWTYGVGTDDVPVGARSDAPTGFTLPEVLRRQPDRWVQYISNVGWLDVPLPGILATAWLALWLGLAFLALRGRVPLRARWSLGLVLLGVLVVPIMLEWPLTHRLGFFWQGRYALPVAVGVPLLAAAVLASRRLPRDPPRWAFPVAFVVTGFVGMWSFVRAFMRYSSSYRVYSIFGPWQPRVPFLVLALGALGAMALLVALVLRRSPAGEVGGGEDARVSAVRRG